MTSGTSNGSLAAVNLFEVGLSLAYEFPETLALRKHLPGEHPVLYGIPIALGGARSDRSAMHATPRFARYCGRRARPATASFGPTSRAFPHGPNISGMSTAHEKGP